MKSLVQQLTAPYVEIQRDHFQYLHTHAELSFQEYQTGAYIKEKLQMYGVTLDDAYGDTTSVVGMLSGNMPGPTIAFRADIDALPIQEESGVPYASCTPGVMHDCGHDSHAATLLTLAQILSEHKEHIKGNVKFIFQAAE